MTADGLPADRLPADRLPADPELPNSCAPWGPTRGLCTRCWHTGSVRRPRVLVDGPLAGTEVGGRLAVLGRVICRDEVLPVENLYAVFT